MHATQVAIRNSQEEKRNALRNAIINAALPDPPEQSLQLMFLNFLDIFTTWHLWVLQLYHEPALHSELKDYSHRTEIGGGLSVLLEKVYPELRDKRAFYDQVWTDLYSRGLVIADSLHGPY